MDAGLESWLDTPLGRYVLAREQAFFDAEVVDVFGFRALQLGLAGRAFLRANRMPLRAVVGLEPAATVRADPHELPLDTGSVDLLLLPHVLEFATNPHQVLREAQRVLRPEGRLLLSGFNPRSLWGVARALAGAGAGAPWSGQFISLPRLKDWLALLGFELEAGRMAAYAPPWGGEGVLRRFGFMDQAGDRWWPIAGGVYLLRGVKRVPGARLITPRWRRAGARRRGLVPAQPMSRARGARREGGC